VSAEIDAMCKKALSSNPDDRYRTADEFRVELEQYLTSIGKLAESRSKLGAAVSELFKDKRAELKTAIEKQLSAASSPHGSELTPMMLTLHGSDRERSSRRMLQIDVASAQTAAPQTPTRKKMSLGVIGGGVAIAAVFVVGLAMRGRGSDPQVKANGIAAPVPNEASAQVSVLISASPPSARIAVDGNSVFSPYAAKLDRSANAHVVRIEADGYEPQTKSIVFDRDLTLSVALNRAVAVAPDRTAPAGLPGAGAAQARPAAAFNTSLGSASSRNTAKTAAVDPPAATPVVAAGVTSPREPAPATPPPAPTKGKKDIDRSNPFQGASSGTGPVKGIDKSNPFAQ
jgi:hypothetical protein